jgi:hypothetical protein
VAKTKTKKRKQKPVDPKKRIASSEEVANDGSLRWSAYRKYEVVWSDRHQEALRFSHYARNGEIVLASLNGMAEMPGTVPTLSIRRLSTM